MGAKQSKRSVDISGKEAESAGEVAAAGAGGEGRLEAIADADTLKPQLNGDAHIQPPDELTDKEKQLDSGTPENEKDATTEKETKDQENDKPASPVTNGESDSKVEQEKENGEAPTPEQEGKKPKKEKVKKKWSLRSISFSRKDKPKQEKKQKDEEPKTNGEPEKVPEEAAEATAEENKVTENAKIESEAKEDKTPETPVTEPITNGSSTPESPQVEATEVPAVEVIPPNDRPETKNVTAPEQLPVNGLSLEEPKKEVPEVAETVESKPEETIVEPTETVPVPETPVKTEVCVEQVPLVESTPPPLPANPPPSSVASFAATTMAPELTDASLANTAETDTSPPPAIPISEIINVITPDSQPSAQNTENIDLSPNTLSEIINDNKQTELVENGLKTEDEAPESPVIQMSLKSPFTNHSSQVTSIETLPNSDTKDLAISESIIDNKDFNEAIPQGPMGDIIKDKTDTENKSEHIINDNEIKTVVNSNHVLDNTDLNGLIDKQLNGNSDATEQENVKNKTKNNIAVLQEIECNGNIKDEQITAKQSVTDMTDSVSDDATTVDKVIKTDELIPASLSEVIENIAIPPPVEVEDLLPNVDETNGSNEVSESFPLPPSELCPTESEASAGSPEPPSEAHTDTQDSLPVHDKIADLIPEVPDLPTETTVLQETASDVAVAN